MKPLRQEGIPATAAWLGLACCAALLALAGAVLRAQPAASAEVERLHVDVRERIERVPAEVQDAQGNTHAAELVLTSFRPPGPGPFPLVLISHGRSTDKRAAYKRPRYEMAARFFVRKGFAVAVPLRLGYGELVDAGDPEDSLSCRDPRFAPALTAAAVQIQVAIRHMQQQADIDPRRLVLVGQSVGGMATVAAAAAGLPGLVAAINFAGGHGGDPARHPGEPCGAARLRQLFHAYGELTARQDQPPKSLWIYTENDRYFATDHSRAWAQAFSEAGAGLDYRLLPAFGEDGHNLFSAGNDVWQPLVDAFLAPLGFAVPGLIAVPPANPKRAVDDERSLPFSNAGARESYRKFLAAMKPRAFAFNAQGYAGYGWGDAALARALAYCQRYAHQDCQLYAVDDTVVWSGSP